MISRLSKTGFSVLLVCGLFGNALAVDYALDAKPLALSETIKPGDRVDRIRFLGMLQLSNPVIDGMRFSQLSGLAWDDDDEILYALSDKGFLFHLRPSFDHGILTGLKLLKAVQLRELNSNKPLKRSRADSEGLDIIKGRNGQKGDAELLISFESFPRIMRYRPDGYALYQYPLPAPLNNVKNYQDANKMLESVCLDSKLGILTAPEKPLRGERPGYTHIFNLTGDSWLLPLPDDSRISALECLGNNQVMTLGSNFKFSLGYTIKVALKIATLPSQPSPSEPITVETIATLESNKGHQLDNFEGLARHRGNRFFIVSDDNDLFIQRTLLMYFELLDK